MPSRIHQTLTTLLSESPHLVPRLLRQLLGIAIADNFELLPAPETVRQIQYPEYTADSTVLVHDVDRGEREALIIEVQLRPDSAKRQTWPLYVAGLRVRLGCPATLVVFAPDARTARWCAEPIDLGRGHMTMRPMVIGPEQIPDELDEQTACANPELALLAVITHGRGEGAVRLGEVALAANRTLATTDVGRATLYTDLALAFLSEAAVRALEDQMGATTESYFSDYVHERVSAGLAQGQAQGREEGREEGRTSALADAVLVVFESRGLVVDDAVRARVGACTDADQLSRWLARAATASTVAEVLDAGD